MNAELDRIVEECFDKILHAPVTDNYKPIIRAALKTALSATQEKLDQYTRLSEIGESLGGELEEMEARIATQEERDKLKAALDWWQKGNGDLVAAQEESRRLREELCAMEARKDAAYLERNQVVAAFAKCYPSGIARTAIEGWSDDWHSCVYIDLPTGQVSWHYHDSQGYLFENLPLYQGKWDGHDTPEKYRRLAATPTTAAQTETKAWLIEMPEARWGTGYFWIGGDDWGVIDRAVRFARKVDAERVMALIQVERSYYRRGNLKMEACEHMWLNPKEDKGGKE